MSRRLEHTFAPVFDSDSRVLILGTFPSPKSRENGFYYGHPQNRFWCVLSRIFDEEVPETIAAKEDFLIHRHIALWDVVASCEIHGADDNSIRNPLPNDIKRIIDQTKISTVFTTGKTAFSLYQKLCFPATSLAAQYLPSPSPANCRFSLDQLTQSYRVILTASTAEIGG